MGEHRLRVGGSGYGHGRRRARPPSSHDVPPALAAEALSRARDQAETPALEPWPLDAWPDVPTKYLLCRDDRFFPAEWMRGVVRERLGIAPDEIDGGHCPALSRPRELSERLEAYRTALGFTDS